MQCLECPQCRKASGYSGIKAALRCSFATCFAHKPLNASLHSFIRGLQGRSQALEVHRKAWEYKLRNAWEYQQYRKASGYSSIKAALQCSSATRLVHKPLKASLRSLVHGLQGRSQALDALRNDWEYPLRNAWEYQQYRKASGFSSIKAALRCSFATCFAHKPLKASLHSFARGLQGRSQAFDALRNDWEYPLRKAWKYKLCNAWEYPQYRKASGYSSIKASLRCSSATCFAHKPLNASLRSFVHGLQGRSQAFEVLRNDWE